MKRRVPPRSLPLPAPERLYLSREAGEVSKDL